MLANVSDRAAFSPIFVARDRSFGRRSTAEDRRRICGLTIALADCIIVCMRIGIDIDDTIMDTFDYMVPFVAEYFGLDPDEMRKNDISYSTLPDGLREREFEFGRKYYDKVVPDTPVKTGAAEHIKKLHDAGHFICIITARDERLYSDAFKTTSEQLKKSGIVYDKLVCAYDKADVCERESIDIFIDDSLKNCENVAAKGIRAVLFRGKGNAGAQTDIPAFATWKDLYGYLISVA